MEKKDKNTSVAVDQLPVEQLAAENICKLFVFSHLNWVIFSGSMDTPSLCGL